MTINFEAMAIVAPISHIPWMDQSLSLSNMMMVMYNGLRCTGGHVRLGSPLEVLKTKKNNPDFFYFILSPTTLIILNTPRTNGQIISSPTVNFFFQAMN